MRGISLSEGEGKFIGRVFISVSMVRLFNLKKKKMKRSRLKRNLKRSRDDGTRVKKRATTDPCPLTLVP